MSKIIWLYGRENSSYMWGNLGQYDTLDKGLMIRLYGQSNLVCVMSESNNLNNNELKKATKWPVGSIA